METELVYRFKIYVFNEDGKVLARVDCGHFEFPSEEEIKAALKEHGGKYAEVHRIYVLEPVPFT